MLSSTTLRIENNVLENISKIAAKLHLDRGTFLRQLVMKAYEEEVLDLAIEEYKKGAISLTEIAEKTNRSVWEVIDLLKQRKIGSNISLEDLKGASKLFAS